MPQVSSIIKSGADEKSTEVEVLGVEALWERLGDRVDTGSLFSLALEARFPMIDIPRIYGAASHRQFDFEKGKYSLGSGVSCSVHTFTLEHDVSPDCSSGTVVALKHYTSRGDGYSAKNLRKWLWNELRVFRHPYLRSQANLCQLRFIGWEENNLTPLVALELAQYGELSWIKPSLGFQLIVMLGTLADCLQDIRSYGTSLEKAHITLDIALGLTAIHSARLVHGDVKPANIIVCEHNDGARKVIAKLSDFGGVSPAETYEHEFGTTLWEAPEVLLNQGSIDWQGADVYSFGLVVATLWHAKGWIPPGCTLIEPHIPFKLEDSVKRRVTAARKFTPDHDSTSLLALALGGVAEQDNPFFSLAQNVFKSSLRTLPEHRMTMLQLLKYFEPFADSTGRHLGSPPHPSVIDPGHWVDTSVNSSVVMNRRFMERPPEFKSTLFQAIRSKAVALERSIVIPQISDIEDDFQGDINDLDTRILQYNIQIINNVAAHAKLLEFASCASSVAFCYLLGMGTAVDKEEAMRWLGMAALAGEGLSILYYSPIEKSVGGRSQVVLPRKMWCACGLRAGVTANAQPLEDLDPDLFRRAQYLRQNNYVRGMIPSGRQPQAYLSALVERIRQDATIVDQEIRGSYGVSGQRALHLCAAAGAIEHVRFLLDEAHAGINVVNDDQETPIFVAVRAGEREVVNLLLERGADVSLKNDKGMSILHVLSDMEDQDAETFVKAFVQQGARIDLAALQEPSFYDNYTDGCGTPLFWAALRSKKSLFVALLECHAQPEFNLSKFDFVTLLRLLSVLHMHDLLAHLVEQEKLVVDATSMVTTTPTIWQTKLKLELGLASIKIDAMSTPIGPREYTDLLKFSSDRDQQAVWARRCIHGRDYGQAKEKTLKGLLNFGADPKSILLDVIQRHDITTFKLLISHLETEGADIFSILSDSCLFVGCSALQRAIYSDARAIFMFLIDAYPDLLNLIGGEGRRPLQSAATQEWPGYTLELLQRQASPHDRASDGSTAFTWCLMRCPNTSAAMTITKMIASNENTNMNYLLGPDPRSGFTAFAKLLSGLLKYKMDFGIDRLEYFIKEFGKPQFIAKVPEEFTVFETVLACQIRPLPTDEQGRCLRLEIIKLLLEQFSEEINFVSKSGVTPLHQAVLTMDPAAVKLLIERGADVNIETRKSDIYPVPGGLTCLDLVKSAVDQPVSDRILKAGQREIAKFETDIKEVAMILIRNGANGGSQSDISLPIWVAKMEGKEWASNVHVQYGPSRGPHRNNRSKDGDWPKRLPREGQSQPHLGPRGYTEYVNEDGLTRLEASQSLHTIQVFFGAIDSGVVTGNRVKPKSEPPKEYLEGLESEVEKRKEQRSIQARLPPDCDVNIAPGGRFYYRDHKNRTTTWDEPRQLR